LGLPTTAEESTPTIITILTLSLQEYRNDDMYAFA